MDHRTPFDRAIDHSFDQANCFAASELIGSVTDGRTPEDVRNALVFVVDMLRHCWLGAQHIFGKPKPEIALEIYDRVLNRVQAVDPEKRAAAIRQEMEELARKHASSHTET